MPAAVAGALVCLCFPGPECMPGVLNPEGSVDVMGIVFYPTVTPLILVQFCKYGYFCCCSSSTINLL